MKYRSTWVCGGIVLACAASCMPTVITPPDTDVIYDDDFSSDALGEGWTFTGDDASRLSLSARAGFVRLTPRPFDPADETSNLSVLLREATGDFVLIAKMEFAPGADRQLAGLVIEGAGDANISFGVLRADAFANFLGLSVASVDQSGGVDTAFERASVSDVFLRVQRTGDFFSFSFSEDGVSFTLASETALENALGDPVQVGIGNIVRSACASQCDSPSDADFDFFEIRQVASSGGG